MKKVRISLIAALIFGVFSAAVIAGAAGGFFDGIINKSDTVTINKDAFYETDNYIKTAMEKDYQSPETYLNLLEFSSFVIEENLNIKEVRYLEKLLKKGYPCRIIIDVTKFWKTTNEDITLIEKICEKQGDYWGRNWIENAFNNITENKCGVIKTSDELNSYLDKGLTLDDIECANILCRKGKMTIQEILDEKISGKSWDDIFEKNGIKLSDGLSKSDLSGYNKLKLSDLKSKGIEISSLLSVDEKSFGDKITTVYEDVKDKAKERVIKNFEKLGIKYEKNKLEEFYASENAALEKLSEKQVPEYYIDNLEAKGFSYGEILNISEAADSGDIYETASHMMKGGE